MRSSSGGKTDPLYTLIAGLIIVIAVIAVWRLWSDYVSDKSSLPTVDFSDTVKSEGKNLQDDRPLLRVAISAMISPEVTKRQYEELLRIIGDRLGMRLVFVQRRTYAEVNLLVENKEVGLAFVCSGPYVSGHDKFGMEIVAVPVVNGKRSYHSYIIVGKDSPFNSLSDLRGRRFAFTDPDSNTGSLVPRYMLSRIGETPESFFSDTLYTHSHDNSIREVAAGHVDGAAVDSLIWEYFNAVEPDKTARTRVIEKSPPYGIPPVVVHPDTDPHLKKKLHDTLIGLHKDPEGMKALSRLRIERFDDADEKDYDEVRKMQAWLSEKGR